MSKMNSFIDYASDILADTENGITTANIISICNKFSVEYNVNIPHTRIYNNSCTQTFPNKRTALKENLLKFNDEQAFNIIEYICDSQQSKDTKDDFRKVKIRLYRNFPQYVKKDKIELDINYFEVKELLNDFPKAKEVYDDAVNQYKLGVFERNTIDNLRLTLELIVKQLLCNEKSLENNEKDIYKLLENKKCSKEFINMFNKLLDYYIKYNNDNVKHNLNINKNEIEFIFEITYSFIKILIND